jgi:hypothetical protein
MQTENPRLDLNAVPPRLTELKDSGLAQTTGKRRCGVTERLAFTWSAVAPGRDLVPCVEHSPIDAAAQGALF